MKRPSLFRSGVLLGLCTLLMGTDGPALTTADLPGCPPETYLVYRGGRLVCEPKLPDCTGLLLNAAPGGTLSSLHCVLRDADALTAWDRQHLQELEEKLKTLRARLTELEMAPSLAATFVGATAATTTGRIELPGIPAGLPSANALCAAEYGKAAHMCTARELFGAVLNSTLTERVTLSRAWLYMPTWSTPDPFAQQPLSGLADNCGGYTDGTSMNGWSGTALMWSTASTGSKVLQFVGGPAAPCTAAFPVACCK
jgi:hypothetical protein